MPKIPTPRKAMRLKCLECSNGSSFEVRHCQVYQCHLYPHRFGKRPVQADIDKHFEYLDEE